MNRHSDAKAKSGSAYKRKWYSGGDLKEELNTGRN